MAEVVDELYEQEQPIHSRTLWKAEYGDQMASRVAASMLENIGVDKELVARDLDDYAERCVRLATDGPYYDDLRKRIEDSRTTADMWDPSIYGKRLSDGFMAVWEHYLTTGGAEKKRKDIYVTDEIGRGTAARV